jgi:hypothetical protein
MSTIRFNNAVVGQMVNDAVTFCAEKAGLKSVDQAIQALHSGDCCVCEYLQYALAQKIAEYLGSVDDTVQAVYTFEPEQAIGVGEIVTNHPILSPRFNLIARVSRKSAALSSVVASINSALAKECQQLGCPKANAMCYELDVEVVDEDEVQKRIGYGALISSLYVRPIEIWQRH